MRPLHQPPIMLSKLQTLPNLEARLTVIRRRRRRRHLKQLAMASPLVLGTTYVLLAGFGGIAGVR